MRSKQHLITILTGEPYFNGRKTFEPDPNGGLPRLLDKTNHCATFLWRTETLVEGAELESLRELMLRQADQPREVRVYALPHADQPQGAWIRRCGETMSEPPGGVMLFMVDVDKWKTEIEWWIGPQERDLAIQQALLDRKLDYLAAAPCLCVLSQSAFPGGPLSCHLFYWFPAPVVLEDLTRWGHAINNRLERKEIDTSIYRAVQVEYIARRECLSGLCEPFTEAFRVSMIDGVPDLEALPLLEGVEAEIKAGELYRPVVSPTGVDVQFSGDGWQMLAQAGSGGVIDDWCFRAAAKIVHQEGLNTIMENIAAFAERMHQVAWQNLQANSNGERGGKGDAETYTVSRFRQFLKSACDRRFGNDVDSYLATVAKAVEDGPRALFSGEVIDAAARLNTVSSWKGHYMEIRGKVKAHPDVRVSEWDREVEKRSKLIRKKARVDSKEALSALDQFSKAPIYSDITDEEGHIIDSAFFKRVVDSFDWLADENFTVMVDMHDPNLQYGGYHALTKDDELRGLIENRGREVLAQVNETMSLPQGFASSVGSLMNANRQAHAFASEGKTIPSRRWSRRAIAQDYYRPNNHIWWINLGIEDGIFNCMRVDTRGLTRMTWLEALEEFPDAPVWIGDPVNKGVGHNDPHGSLGVDWGAADGLREMPEGQWARKLFELVRTDTEDDECRVLVWLLATMLDWDTRFIAQFVGEAGVGKSTAGDVLCALVDPQSTTHPLRAANGRRLNVSALSGENFEKSLRGRRTAQYDNVSSLTAKQQDKLCAAVTGFGVNERVLYVGSYMAIRLRASIIITGLSPSETSPDFADRLLTIELRQRGTIDQELNAAFNERRGEIFDGLVHMGAEVMRRLAEGQYADRDRQQLLHLVSDIYLGSRGERSLVSDHIRSLADLVSGDRFAPCFLAWLQFDEKNWGPGGKLNGAYISTSALYEKYQGWFKGDGAGRTFRIHLQGGSMAVKIVERSFEKKNALPTSAKAFGKQISRWTQAIKTFGVPFENGIRGWCRLEPGRDKSSKGWIIERISISDDEYLI